MDPASGIIPYIKTPDDKLYFLLGYETNINKWSGFVGGYEENDNNIINTAIREFNEETAKIFEHRLDFIKNKILSRDSLLITGSTKNRMVYLWFIKFPAETINENVEQRFLNNRNLMTDKHYKEKNKLKWFEIADIHKAKNNILFKLRQVILSNYLNM